MARKIWTKLFITVLTISLTTAFSCAKFSIKAEKPVKLEWKLKAGDVLTYKSEMDQTVSPGMLQKTETKIEMLSTSIVTEVDKDGVMTGGDIMIMNSPGQPGFPRNFLMTWKRHPNGQQESPAFILGMQEGIGSRPVKSLPEKPVKVGDSWSREATKEISLPLPLSMKMTASSTFTSTLLGFEKIKGYKCAKIKTIVKGPVKGKNYTGFVSSENMTFFALNYGFPVKMESTMESTANMVMKQPLKIKMKAKMQMEMQMELSKREKLKPDELKQAREELLLIRAAQKLIERKKQKEAKAKFEEFLANHPESRWRKGVVGLISQIDLADEMKETMKEAEEMMKKWMKEKPPKEFLEEAQKLEEKLKENPDDLSIRSKLLEHYSSRERFRSESARKARQKHIFWLIKHHPDAKIAGLPEAELHPMFDKEAYVKAKQLWLEQVETHKENTAVLGNAANFFLLYDRDIAEDLFKRAQALEPDNPRWYDRLGHLYALGLSRKTGKAKRETAVKSLKQREKALSLTVGKRERFYKLSELAKVAFEAEKMEKAKNYATELLDKAPRYGNDGNAIHHGNLILGRLALNSGDLEKAKVYLIEAGKTPGSPQLNSFGPNMALAKELLEKGEREVVIKYFQLCAKFWKNERGRLEKWTSIVKEGGIPDFGANLYY